MEKPRVWVAVGVIQDSQGRVFICRRPDDKHQGGKWEFPGGKVEAGETVQQALARELAEEIGIRVTALAPLLEIRHDYADKAVLLDVWRVTGFDGDPHGREGQAARWVELAELADHQFPEGNRAIVARLLGA